MVAEDENVSREMAQVVAKLQDAIGRENVKTSKMERLLYSHDLAPLPNLAQIAFKDIPDVVVRPHTTEDVVKIVKIAAEDKVPITPRGASTWGLGGSTPVFGGILIDMSGGMNKILEINKENLYVKAQAGCTWKEVYDACMEQGLLLGGYPSSFPSATLGGWISVNGVGVGSMKYGTSGDLVRNMEVVMPDGTVVQTGYDLIVDNETGYNLNRLIVGAEGTLAHICTVTFKLEPAPEVMRSLTYSFPTLKEAGKPLMEICRSRVRPLHIGFSDHNHFDLLRKAGRHTLPEGHNVLNIQLEGDKEIVAWEERKIDEIMAKYGGKKLPDEVAAHEWEERCYEYRCREIGIGSIPGEAVMPLNTFEETVDACYNLLKELKLTGAIIGSIVDRNTVMFMPYYLFNPDELQNLTSFGFNAKFANYALSIGGRPLGFGAFFASNLDAIRGTGAKYIRDIKRLIDPDDIMNPGKLTGTTLRYGIRIPPALFNLGMGAMGVIKRAFPTEDEVAERQEAYAQERANKARDGRHKGH
ncbi:MAG TPA: FAD-binding oxidoreductase [Methanomassiliicoccales archaeon]|nr:FAD-binding oxidoreductase [Methanomassiliicoccales archaeon]